MEEVLELKQQASHLPDDYLVCLVGDMITKEALPTYQSVFNTFEGVRDTTGASPMPWGVGFAPGQRRRTDIVIYSSGSTHRQQPIQRIHLHILPGACHIRIPRKHDYARQGA
ncbi:hypothetical protein O6H91_02G012200 [Diphasiastrum complanatum]|uniref:Uncharacterized protein n=1 Tax=Diphasiastrum complanatum TaxID=34168 RepID=A0ACC2ECW6_DIPCM|nr:hypothetical protein O6H91_02G012200 [Diphasiastrum complanatum]